MRKTRQYPKNVSVANFVWTFALLNAAIVLAFGVGLYQSHVRTEASALSASKNISQMLDDSITASESRINAALQMVVYDLERQLHSNGSLDEGEVGRLLKATRPAPGELSKVLIATANGQVLYGDGISRSKDLYYGKSGFFIDQRDHPNKGLIVFNADIGAVAKQGSISFSRRYNHPDGSFAGVVVSAMPISYFANLFSKSGVGTHGVVVLCDANLGMIVRHPALDTVTQRIGTKTFSVELKKAIDSGRSTVSYHTKESGDGTERTSTYRRLTALPFHLVVGLGTEDYMKPWEDELNNSLIKLAALMIMMTVLLIMLHHRTAALMQATQVSLHDSLTSLPNRRAFDLEYERLKRQAIRNHSAISVLFIDIDLFKKFNDTYGHEIGDTVLKHVAGSIDNCLHRPLDMVCRWGGEEFVAALPGTEQEDAEQIANNILWAVRQIEMAIGLKRLNFSVSIGIASMKLTAEDAAYDLIDMADRAMLTAKMQGRDRYVVFEAWMKAGEQK
jgi:diguanylate cyclase (GGDEF)-like protein